MSLLDFSQEDHDRAARYHRPLYAAAAIRFLIAVAVFGAFTRLSLGGLGRFGAAAVWAVLVLAGVGVACLPLDLWRGLVRERRFGLSTQTLRGWLADWAKGEAIELVLAAAVWVAAVGLARAFPRWWPLPAAAALALFVLLMSFVAPVVLEPLFNRFRPLEDERLAGELRALAERAGVPVRDVLVADASRRTTRTNAYVSGLGPTRRVVVWDTLLADASEPELKLIVAHELGHRRDRHVLKGTLLGMSGAIVVVLVLWAVLGSLQPRRFPLCRVARDRDRDRRPAGDLVDLPPVGASGGTALARADARPRRVRRCARCLARKNLSDLDPPRLAYLMLFSHPTAPERLALARA